MYIAKSTRRRADGTHWVYFILRETVWDSKLKRQKHIYKGYLGTSKRISEAKACALAKKLGISIAELKAVRGLKIAEGVAPEPEDKDWRARLRGPWERI